MYATRFWICWEPPAEYGRAGNFLHRHVPDRQLRDGPKDELNRTDHVYELRCGAIIKFMVEAAQVELLNPDGSIKNCCKTKVSNKLLNVYYSILYHRLSL
jgi:hypothetical protein